MKLRPVEEVVKQISAANDTRNSALREISLGNPNYAGMDIKRPEKILRADRRATIEAAKEIVMQEWPLQPRPRFDDAGVGVPRSPSRCMARLDALLDEE